MRLLFVLLIAPALFAQAEAQEIVRRAVEQDNANWDLARSYTYVERSEVRFLDGKAGVKKRKIETFDVTLADGTPYRRLIQRDDKPLPESDERKERQKLEKSIDERRQESPAKRQRRLDEWKKKQEKNTALLRQLPAAFDFKLLSEERLNGRPAWLIEAEPRPDYRPPMDEAKLLTKMRGRLWIDRETNYIARVEAETIDTLSWGLFLARLARGSRITLELARVNNEVWLPSRVDVTAGARLALVKKLNIEQRIAFRDYRKFQAESRVVSTEEVAP